MSEFFKLNFGSNFYDRRTFCEKQNYSFVLETAIKLLNVKMFTQNELLTSKVSHGGF